MLSIDKILNSSNVAELLSDKELDEIGQDVCEGFEEDKNSRKDWEEKIGEWNKLALQVAETKNTPFENAANVKYPLITNAALQFSSRAYPALLTGPVVVRGRVIGFDTDGTKLDKAVRIGKHMSWQLMEQMEDWEEQMDKLLFSLPIVGCMFKKTYFDSVKNINVSEIVYPKELVVNYFATTLEDAERVTHVLKFTENDIRERVAYETFLDVELEEPSTENPNDSNSATGIERGSSAIPYEVLEQCNFIDLDGDGYKEPYVCTVDSVSRKVLRIVARFSEKSIKRHKDKIACITPDHYYTKYSFIPSPDAGFYDIGFGILLGPINDTVNTLINQLLDSGTLNNLQSGFISKGIRIKGGDKNFKKGEWKYVNSPGDDLRKGIVPLPTKEPSQVLFSLLGMMIDAGEKLSSSTDMMSGQIPGQNTKATVAMAAIDQGMKVFKSIYKRIHRSLTKEFRKLYYLNSLFLPEETYFAVLDVGQEEAKKILRADYSDDTDVVPTSDPNVATEEQKMAKVQALFELLQIGTVNPQVVTKRYLEATEQPNVEELMKMPEPQPNPEAEMEKAKFEDESKRGWEELAIRRITAESVAIKNIASAEAEEEGTQLGQYGEYLKQMQNDDLAGQKSEQQRIEFIEKMKQKEAMAQQQMRHKEMLNQQRGSDGSDPRGNGGMA